MKGMAMQTHVELFSRAGNLGMFRRKIFSIRAKHSVLCCNVQISNDTEPGLDSLIYKERFGKKI
jgi:hypothetical protein